MRLGLFGGTFDPPHLAHMILAADAAACLKLDRVLWVLTPDPPHKDRPDILPVTERIKLVNAAIADNPTFELSSLEIDRPGPHYAVDTVKAAIETNSNAQIYFLMGGDSLHDLPTWRTPQAFVESCSGICVMRRPDDKVDLQKLETVLPGISMKVTFVPVPLIDISSSEIRRRILEGKPYRYFLPPPVFQTIQLEHLYQQEQ